MSNRRSDPRGGNHFSPAFSNLNVNPWQSSQRTNALNQSGILSQLRTNPQFAIALSTLLQPQQQQLPSLLSLNTSGYSDSRDFGRFSGDRRRDFRRNEPYTKGNGVWRTDRRFRQSQSDKKRDDQKSEAKKDVSKEKLIESIDLSVEESINEENKEDKRDWKDEKNRAEGKEHTEAERKNAKGKEGKFAGVPAKYLNCFVCNKQMWNGESMRKHLKGRAHYEMLKALEENIHICVNILRENMRLSEERKVIELKRQDRLKKYGGRKNFGDITSHCNMCDLKFLGKIVTHRKSHEHQRLKRYLHPTCRICEKEFPSRMEWIEHRLTPDHLIKFHEISKKPVGGKNGDEIVESMETESNIDEAPQQGDDDNEVDREANAENADTEDLQDLALEPLLDEALQMENDDPILELDDVLDGFQNRIPAYKRDRQISVKSIQPFTGFVCILCHKSFVNENDSQNHLKTRYHYYKFIETLKEQFERNERKSKKTEKQAQKETDSIEDTQNCQENGKLEAEGGEDEDISEMKKNDENVEMYDPAIYTGSHHDDDDEDDEDGYVDELNNTQVSDGEDSEAPILVEDDEEDETYASMDTAVIAVSVEAADNVTVTVVNPAAIATDQPETQPESENKPDIVQRNPLKLQTPQKSPKPSPASTPAAAQNTTPSRSKSTTLQAMQNRTNVRNGTGPRSKRGRRS